MSTSPTWLRITPLIAIACWLVFIATVVAMPFIKDGYSPFDQPISEGVLGEHRSVQTIGFFSLAMGTLLITACLRSSIPLRSSASITVGLLGVSAICVILLAGFVTDESGQRTWQGRVHVIAAALAFVTIVVAMLWSGWAFRHTRELVALAPVSLAIGIVTLALLVALSIGAGPEGLVQRATVACELVWLTTIALWVRSHADVPVHKAQPLRGGATIS